MKGRTLFAAYLRQQKELSLPDIPVSRALDTTVIPQLFPAAKTVVPAPSSPAPAGSGAARKIASDRLARVPLLVAAPAGPGSQAAMREGKNLTFEQKRAVFKELFAARCEACPLARTRRSFVFGAGNVDASLMIIGEAPGAEEDQQGLPFVGAAGQLLTELCASIALDRKKDIFIT
ncbi:MAG: uracil-DNA glycosylase, partial [Chitinispirillaceae bacterium]|nr:uracil-DNA glycosylase [Chitinispirillaceae bacterium]